MIIKFLPLLIGLIIGWQVAAQNTHSSDFEADGNQGISLDDEVAIIQPLNDPWTIMAWVKLESYDGTDRQMIYFDSETGAGEDSFINMMVRGSNRRFGCDIRDNTGSQGTADSEDGMAEVGRWYHFACQRDGTTMRVFVNGRLAGTGTGAGGLIQATSGTLLPCIGGTSTASGCATATDETFDGLIDEISFWRRALTESQIQAIMRQEINATASTTVTQGLEALFKFDNNTNDSVGRTTQLAPTLVGTPGFSTDAGWKQFDPFEF